MQGDFSRRTFDRKKQFCGVFMQQGRVQVDADWNEQVLLEDCLRTTEARDVIGLAGAPKYGGGFQVGVTPDRQDLTLSPGRLYVGGMLCEPDPRPLPIMDAVSDRLTLASLSSEGRALTVGGWIALTAPDRLLQVVKITGITGAEGSLSFAPPLSDAELAALQPGSLARPLLTYFTQPWVEDHDLPEAGRYLVYLDVWRRHVSAVEDPAIREVALGGPDTATRMQTVWQVKLLSVAEEDESCECAHFPPGWSPEGPSPARLEARTASSPQVTDPCLLPPGSGYLGLENQLYRVEVHKPGGLHEATFKWSRDNGSVVTAVKHISGQVMEVQDLGRDHHLGFAVNDWVEYLDDRLELQGRPGILLLIADLDPAGPTITFSSGASLPASCEPEFHPRLRRWHQAKGSPDQGILITDAWLPLEHGLEVRFSGNSFRTGDYWLIPARTATRQAQGHIEWPWDELTAAPLAQPPLGIEHAYCPLALVEVDGQGFKPSQPTDCRRIFPPLIEVGAGAETGRGCCRVTVGNGRDSCGDYNDLQAAIDDLPADGGRICLLPGDHLGNFIIRGKKHLMISGCQWRTRVLPSPDPERRAKPVFLVEDCESVVLEFLDIVHLEGTGIEAGVTAHGALKDLEIRDNRIHAWTHAVKVTGGEGIVIRNNRIRMLDADESGVAVFLGGEHCRIDHNSIVVIPGQSRQAELPLKKITRFPNPVYECTARAELYRHQFFVEYLDFVWKYPPAGHEWDLPPAYQGSGGLQIAGGSEDIRIVGNEITGGSWNGITLGHLPEAVPEVARPHRRSFALASLPSEAKSALHYQFRSFLYDIIIDANDIRAAGLNGIGVVSFFALKDTGLLVSVNGLTITNNRISRCLRQASDYVTEGLWLRMEKDMGLGGIALADCENLVIRENTIADNGTAQQEPVCGIFLLHGEKVDISDNRLVNNGPPPTPAGSKALRGGQRGGIVISLSFKEWWQELREHLQERDFPLPDGIPAVKIHHNLVSQPLGRALTLTTFGPVTIVGNHLTSLGIDSSSRTASLAGTVFVMNLGISKDVVGALVVSHGFMPRSLKAMTTVSFPQDVGMVEAPDLGMVEALQHLPAGQVLYADNQTTLNLLTAGFERALSSQLLVSMDDVSYIGNQSECISYLDVVFVDAGLVGATVRTCNNRFQSGFTLMWYSLISFGFMNTTMGNQATHCLITLGLPQFLQDTANTVAIGANCPDYLKQIGIHYLAAVQAHK
jgi:hypothetical protein